MSHGQLGKETDTKEESRSVGERGRHKRRVMFCQGKRLTQKKNHGLSGKEADTKDELWSVRERDRHKR